MIKKSFMTGLVILLPIVLTIILLTFFINILTYPFQTIIENLLVRQDLLDHPFFLFSGKQILHFSSKIIALVSLFTITIFVGFVGQTLFVNYIRKLGKYFIHHIPVVGKIYEALHEVTHTVFSPKGLPFSEVVMVPFFDQNNCKSYNIGFISNSFVFEGNELVSVFVPGTPNPTFGFMIMISKNELMNSEMKVEEGVKFVVSGGMIYKN